MTRAHPPSLATDAHDGRDRGARGGRAAGGRAVARRRRRRRRCCVVLRDRWEARNLPPLRRPARGDGHAARPRLARRRRLRVRSLWRRPGGPGRRRSRHRARPRSPARAGCGRQGPPLGVRHLRQRGQQPGARGAAAQPAGRRTPRPRLRRLVRRRRRQPHPRRLRGQRAQGGQRQPRRGAEGGGGGDQRQARRNRDGMGGTSATIAPGSKQTHAPISLVLLPPFAPPLSRAACTR